MPARRSLPDYPSLRYLKVEAKERTRSGEFAALHEAQLAIAREHGLPGWPALCRLAGQQVPAQSWVLPHVRWLISRFRDAGEPGWAPPDDSEARQHFSGRVLDVVQIQDLFEIIAADAARLGEELLVLALTPLTGRFRHAGREIWVGVEAEPPHLISGLTGFALGSRITDPRLGAPATSAQHDVPSPAAAAVGEVIAEHGLPGLVLAGQAGRDAPLWTAASGWADLDLREPLTAGHRFPAHHISQLITAAGVLRLIASTGISLDDPANDRLRTITLADPGVTIRELLTHTGGVDTLSSSDPYDPVLRERVPPLADLCGPVLACTGPRGPVQVSAGGYAALGQLITDLTGLPYPDAVTRLVLEPLGMTASSFPASLPGIGAGTLNGYQASAADSLVSVPPNITAIPAAFGLWTTAADLVRFGTGWASLLPASLAREALRPQARMAPGEGSMGPGLVHRPRPRGRRTRRNGSRHHRVPAHPPSRQTGPGRRNQPGDPDRIRQPAHPRHDPAALRADACGPAPAPPGRTGCHSTGTARHRLAKEGFTPASNHAHRDHMGPISLLQDGQLACSVT